MKGGDPDPPEVLGGVEVASMARPLALEDAEGGVAGRDEVLLRLLFMAVSASRLASGEEAHQATIAYGTYNESNFRISACE